MFSNLDKKVLNFFTIEDLAPAVVPTPHQVGYRVDFKLSSTKYEHERVSGTVLGWLSDIGGFNDALGLLTKPLFAYISAFSYSLSVTNDMPTTIQKTS